MGTRPLRLALASFVLLTAMHAHAAPPPSVEALLLKGERAYGNLAYDEAAQVANQVLKQRRLSHEQLVRATRLLTLASGALGQEATAREAALQLLMYEPTFEVDRDLSPKVRAPINEARLFWRDQALQPGVEATPVLAARAEGSLRVELRDPQGVVERVLVGYRWGRSGEYTEKTLAPGRWLRIEVARPPVGETRLEYFVQAADGNDNIVFQQGTAEDPRSASLTQDTPRPSAANKTDGSEGGSLFGSPWFWGIAAAVVAGGVTATYFATRGPDAPPPTTALLTGGIRCGGAPCN